jgi:hypothetical protein
MFPTTLPFTAKRRMHFNLEKAMNFFFLSVVIPITTFGYFTSRKRKQHCFTFALAILSYYLQ